MNEYVYYKPKRVTAGPEFCPNSADDRSDSHCIDWAEGEKCCWCGAEPVTEPESEEATNG